MKIGKGGRVSMLLVAPPRTNSRSRECPYAPMTRRSAFRYVTWASNTSPMLRPLASTSSRTTSAPCRAKCFASSAPDRRVARNSQQIRFSEGLRLHHGSDGAALRRADEPSGSRNDDRSRRARRTGDAINSGSRDDGEPQDSHFPVIGPGRELVGMISREDVMRALREATSGADKPTSSR
jgi:hypothetical protein